MRGREAILKVHARGKPFEPNVDLGSIARGTPGFVGADLENLINEGAILAARRNKKAIGQPELEEAIERVIMGPERKSRLISEEEKRIIAYHEAGHAVVINAIPEADPVQKITIVGRGQAGGLTWNRPTDDRTLTSRKKMLAQLTFFLGGRAAEQIVFDDITSGASNDLENVTKIARTMVTRLGMSDELGSMTYGQKEELIFLGREISEQRDYSEAVAEQIDHEVRKLVDDSYKAISFDPEEIPQRTGCSRQQTARGGNADPRRVREDLPAPVPQERAVPHNLRNQTETRFQNRVFLLLYLRFFLMPSLLPQEHHAVHQDDGGSGTPGGWTRRAPCYRATP